MSILSVYETDKSDLLYKRFAFLASSYLDKPSEAKTPTAQIPLENLFRLLEMFRYDAFSDESRRGILAVGNINDHIITGSVKDCWHTNVKNALRNAMDSVFDQIPKEEAINELEQTLRRLADNCDIEEVNRNKAKSFFTNFIKELK